MRQRSRFFESSADVDMAGEIASDHGLASDTQAQGPTHAEFLQANVSDLLYLRERARAVDARLGIADGRLLFRPRREDGDPPIQLSRDNQLLCFQAAPTSPISGSACGSTATRSRPRPTAAHAPARACCARSIAMPSRIIISRRRPPPRRRGTSPRR